MILLDLFVYTLFSFLTKKLNRNKEDAKFSAILLLSSYLSFFIINIIISLGKFYNNEFTQIFHEGKSLSYIIISVLAATVFCIRYYRILNFNDITERLTIIQANNLKIMKIIITLFMFIIPIWFLILCYTKGTN